MTSHFLNALNLTLMHLKLNMIPDLYLEQNCFWEIYFRQLWMTNQNLLFRNLSSRKYSMTRQFLDLMLIWSLVEVHQCPFEYLNYHLKKYPKKCLHQNHRLRICYQGRVSFPSSILTSHLNSSKIQENLKSNDPSDFEEFAMVPIEVTVHPEYFIRILIFRHSNQRFHYFAQSALQWWHALSIQKYLNFEVWILTNYLYYCYSLVSKIFEIHNLEG